MITQVTFRGIRDYINSGFTHTNDILLSRIDLYDSSTGQISLTLGSLFPNTRYEITVFAVNGAGNGTIATAVTTTLNG